MDALCALPQGIEQQVPASLRCTSMCVVACLGSPIVTPDLEIEQRGVLLTALAAAALAGEHHGNNYVRVADALFVLIAGWAIVLAFAANSPERAKPRHPPRCASLSGALLTYVGLRAVRAGMTHASEAANFRVEAFAVETKGYALGDGVVAFAITFGGSMLACTGLAVMSNSPAMQEHGTSAVTSAVAMNTSFVFVSAFVAQVSVYAHCEDLAALFSDSSCSGDRDSCAEAYRARRLYLTNSSPASLWAGCVAATVLSMPKQRQCSSRADYYESQRISATSGVVATTITVTSAVCIWSFASIDSVASQVELLLLYMSIPLAWFGSTSAACALNASGNILYMQQRFRGSFGLDMDYFTHWSLLVTTVLVCLMGVTTFAQQLLYSCHRTDPQLLARATGALSVAILSVQFALTLLSLSLIAAYDGSLVTSVTSWRTAGYDYTVQHSFTFFFAAAVYGSRYETGGTDGISASLRWITWYTTPLLCGAAWGTTLLFRGRDSPYTQTVDGVGLSVGIVSAVVPWLVTGVGV
jgi:hypothetical protein